MPGLSYPRPSASICGSNLLASRDPVHYDARMPVIADNSQVAALIDRLSDEAAALMRNLGGTWAVIGIRSRGDTLARRFAARLKPAHLGSLDIGLYRDDLSEIGPQPIVRTTEIDFNIDGINVL